MRLGDGTDESHRRMQEGVDALWRFTGELFAGDDIDLAAEAGIGVDPATLRGAWESRVGAVLAQATLEFPTPISAQAAEPDSIPSIWATCWGRCNGCSARIPVWSGDVATSTKERVRPVLSRWSIRRYPC